ncbi:MarR family winged helix-turn-helix transcriptional regulator [Plantactinospora sp. KLBMP9567]|uniref:MarR family winged helix-turn-helix transcriptional regulator n=1 Tax=Plantactinospora sp. KLBMP9567 TaxID=3085900 RepID=UPI0029821B4F|nr:MarR family winged helix-turn-helix transcriptional regulator [Plantactinospora sp. KLBMP9567]MDW5326114.1 MarR family winged helix-turn-helix transcriptional regulator [Plantactinospora sp. KLBMP9567]
MTDDVTAGAAEALGSAVADLHRVLRRSTSRRIGRAPLPDAQVEVLRLVERCPEISVKEAAERLHTAANTVSTLVGDLAGAGLLERARDPHNRRIVRLRLTPAAHLRIAEYVAHRRDLLLDALHRLDEPARRDIVRAAGQLHRLADLLVDQERADQPPGAPGAARP